ncbi:hypothetical protein GCM10020258_41840 [Sphingomonas yabuuchiae]
MFLGAFAPLASFAMFHIVTVFPLSWVVLFNKERPQDFMMIEIIGSIVGVFAILASGKIADRVGRRTLLGLSAAAIAAFAGFAPSLLDQGGTGETIYIVLGFLLLGLGFGQSSGAINSGFSPLRRYTGAAITSDLAWLIGAGFAPLAALLLSSHFGLVAVGAYLLSGAIGTLAALGINKELAKRAS